MSKLLLTEDIFDNLISGATTAWNVLKGQFFQTLRLWINIYEIWQTKSQEELDEVIQRGNDDVDKIKVRYRSFEEQFRKDNSLFNSNFGNMLLFTNPPAALAYAIYNNYLQDDSYKSDVKALLKDSGFDAEVGGQKLFPGMSNWLSDTRSQIPFERQEAVDAKTGERTETIVYRYQDSGNPKIAKAANAIQNISGVFGGQQQMRYTVKEGLLKEQKMGRKEEAKQVTKELLDVLKKQGAIKELETIGGEILKVKETQYQEFLVPAAKTLEMMSLLSSSKNIKDFKKIMKDLARTNKLLKKLDANQFEKQIDTATQQALSNEKFIEDIKRQYKKNEITEDEMKEIIFLETRNEFTKSIVNYLEDIYEGSRALVMDGVTTKGLEKMKKSSFGNEYAKSVEENIQMLDNAVLSLKKLSSSLGE